MHSSHWATQNSRAEWEEARPCPPGIPNLARRSGVKLKLSAYGFNLPVVIGIFVANEYDSGAEFLSFRPFSVEAKDICK